jgi:site-specific DNA recombinase
MSQHIDLFQQWSKRPVVHYKKTSTGKFCVVYTRVSSKEQYETNLSLDTQKHAIEEFAGRNEFAIMGYFGGTYESASTDGRKEFQRMLEFIKKNKEKVTHILVYLLDRFSRTGDGAMRLSKELREKYGVTIIAATQPIDTSNPGGVFQQNMQFLFSEYDNQLRRQRAIAGTKEKLERGIWCLQPPMGYTIVKEDKNRKIVVNEIGKKLRKAFEWKAQGMKNDEILSRLQALGVKIYKQKLSMILSNPFYCGIIAHKTLNGKLVVGDHEKLITQDLFLRIHNIWSAAGGKYGVSHKKENREYPLKIFMKCGYCGIGYTGYTVSKKIKTTNEVGKYNYYKCRTEGCNCNKSTTGVNKDFLTYLDVYSIKPYLITPLMYHMNHAFDRHYEACFKLRDTLQSNLAIVDAKIEELEENYYVDKRVPAETYDRLMIKLAKEKKQILDNLASSNIESSNLKEAFEWAINISLELPQVWHSSEVGAKEKLQKMVFPEGISYFHKNGTFLTEKVNEVFEPIPRLNSITESDKNKQGSIAAALSNLVGMTGFEPPYTNLHML